MDIFSIIEDTVKPIGIGIDTSKVKHIMIPGQILGRHVSSAEELASLMQEYRNPLYETARIFYVRDEKIVSVENYSSHLPGISRIGEGNHSELKKSIADHVKALNADGYYLLHNHPSGNPKPSLEDIWLTVTLARPEDGFLGHIVIDHTKFALIDENGTFEFRDVPNYYEKDIFHIPTLEHPLLDAEVTEPEYVAEIGRKLIDYRSDISIAIFTSGSGSYGKIVAMTEFSNKLAEDKEMLKAYTEKAALAYGATNTFVITTSDKAYEYRRELVEQAYTRDFFLMDEMGFYWCAKEENIEKNRNIVFAGKTYEEVPLYTERFPVEETDISEEFER